MTDELGDRRGPGRDLSVPRSPGAEALDRLGLVLRALVDPPAERDVPSILLEQVVDGLRAEGGVLAVGWGDSLQLVATSGDTSVLVEPAPPSRPGTGPVALAARSGDEVWGTVPPGPPRRSPPAPGLAGSAVALPLRFGGQVVGALGVQFAADRSVVDEECAFLRSVADICALYVDRWHLPGIPLVEFPLAPAGLSGPLRAILRTGVDPGPRRRVLRLGALADLARRLAAAVTTEDVSRIVVEGSSGVLGATFANVSLVDAQAGVVHVLNPEDIDPQMARRYARLPLGAHHLHTDVIREDRLIALPDPGACRDRYPGSVDDLVRVGLAAMASAPLRRSDRTVIGALAVGWPEPVAFDEELRLGIQTVAEMCAETLWRTHVCDARAELVSALQTELLPEVPLVDGLDIAVRYLPASHDLGFSGDWYDVVPLSRAKTAIIVGDVSGHGIRAAAHMSQVRGVVNTLARLGTSVETIFARAQPLLTHLDDPFIGTASLFVADTERNVLSYAHAGHPPIIVRDPLGTVVSLPGARGPALGMRTGVLGPASVPFPPGALAVGYTDGLVERRDRDLATGVGTLCATVAAWEGAEASGLARRIVRDLTEEQSLADDVAMVVVRRAGNGSRCQSA